jgi:hypothetical protein
VEGYSGLPALARSLYHHLNLEAKAA